MIGKLVEAVMRRGAGDGGRAPGPEVRKEGVRWAVTGMATLLSGQKLPALGMFARGVMLLEAQWRADHPEVGPGLRERLEAALEFYERTHQDKKNRLLHVIGIPMVVGGAVGLFAAPSFTPIWWGSAGLFVVGWQLNIAGHVLFEKNKPAFAEDPLAFIAGPVWDMKQLVARLRGRQPEPATAP
ncbi:MAG: DUF962 domain-containing protein [Deltaproteobacteria bacterium]|nr:DUF962 domain-containing protein [Deltaproteobacteria bacterium]